ncbi:MAG: acyltransferase [Gammaproteobacteria bacterium]|nr:acyltransferase [Gammaproteobacteria bacterium]
MQKDGNTIRSLQALRAIAALLVVYSHTLGMVSKQLPVSMLALGGFGVDIFFVISGFIMVYISRDHFQKKNAPLYFLKRRIIRIFPLYWISTAFIVVALMAFGFYHNSFSEFNYITNPHYVFRTILLFPYFDSAGKQIYPVTEVSWTLIYEMFFYCVFSLLLFFRKKIYLYCLGGIFISLFSIKCVLMAPFFDFKGIQVMRSYFFVYGNNVIFEFLFGCFIAELYLCRKFLPNFFSIFLIVLSLSIFIGGYYVPLAHSVYAFIPRLHSLRDNHSQFFSKSNFIMLFSLFHCIRVFGFGIPAFLLVYATLSLEARNFIKIHSVLIKLGNASYSIYLMHLTILIFFLSNSFLRKLILQKYIVSGNLMVFVMLFVCAILGYCVYKYIEMPMLKWSQKITFKKSVLIVTAKNVEVVQ